MDRAKALRLEVLVAPGALKRPQCPLSRPPGFLPVPGAAAGSVLCCFPAPEGSAAAPPGRRLLAG